ncbi:MAG TPA: hypothetical protein VK404_12730 [Spirosoma sp.]|nr:hypothetical protein [Spirosoma sp.]
MHYLSLIRIRAQPVAARELPATVKPTRVAPLSYYIDVSDNGTGIAEQHTGPIFQVFQGLHGKNQFTGMSIGLLILRIKQKWLRV